LWLEDANGKTAVTPGSELITQIKELAHLPLLVVLASCQSAGQPSEAETRTALGPRLAQVGIPAVVAMQGDISQETIAGFMSVFFRALQQDGRIDRAMSLARGRVRRQPDSWMPVLFSRLTSGVLYAEREPEKAAIRIGWRNWSAFAGIIMAATILIIVIAFPSARYELRATLPWVRCQWPLEVTSERKVAVAEFNMPDDFDNQAVKEEIRRSIKKIISNLANNQGSILYCPVSGSPVDLAERINANVLVYGEVIKDKGEWFVQPRFYIRPELSGASELTGEAVFGQRINIGNDPTGTIANQGINELLGPHIANLSLFLDGVVNFKGGHYQSAQASFIKVLQDWPAKKSEPLNSRNRDIVYLWLGNALYYIDPEIEETTCPFDVAAVEDEAVAEFGTPLTQCAWKAFELGMATEPYTSRLYLAKGNWWKELPPQDLLGTAQKCEDYSIAIEYYQQALKDPEELLTAIKAQINIGLAAVLSGDGCSDEQAWYRQAQASLSEAIEQSNQLADDGEVRNYKALAWYTLGRAESRLKEPAAAIAAFDQALSIAGTQGMYHEPTWQWQIRWEAYIGRGRQYLLLAQNGDESAWNQALEDFQAVITAYEKSSAPTDARYAGDAYLGAAEVYAAQGDRDNAIRCRQQAEDLLYAPTESP
jgi:tetratricopeptide (TPR) repeat protein